MKNILVILSIGLLFASCDDVVDLELQETEAPIVIDAWLYRKAEPQKIRISRASNYFNQDQPQGVTGANVSVIDLDDPTKTILFNEEAAGVYTWMPLNETDSFGDIGHSYALDIELDGEHFYSMSSMNRTPKIDSITWRLEEGNAFFDDSYFGEFWARDFEGEGDVYWIKAWKNGEFLSKPSEIYVAYDAGFSKDGNADGLFFIQPIRDALNPFDLDDDNRLIPPYELGDSAYVELNSITLEAFYFLIQVQEQTNRPGGFAELFATPLANVETNIFSDDSNEKIVGFFCTSGVSGLGRKFTEDAIFED